MVLGVGPTSRTRRASMLRRTHTPLLKATLGRDTCAAAEFYQEESQRHRKVDQEQFWLVFPIWPIRRSYLQCMEGRAPLLSTYFREGHSKPGTAMVSSKWTRPHPQVNLRPVTSRLMILIGLTNIPPLVSTPTGDVKTYTRTLLEE
jgi:hypothetical protein